MYFTESVLQVSNEVAFVLFSTQNSENFTVTKKPQQITYNVHLVSSCFKPCVYNLLNLKQENTEQLKQEHMQITLT